MTKPGLLITLCYAIGSIYLYSLYFTYNNTLIGIAAVIWGLLAGGRFMLFLEKNRN